jgi:hypothetical protein
MSFIVRMMCSFALELNAAKFCYVGGRSGEKAIE